MHGRAAALPAPAARGGTDSSDGGRPGHVVPRERADGRGRRLTTIVRPSDGWATAASPRQGRVLVVDDNEANRDLLSRRLRRRGYAVELACDGEAALEALRAAAYDLVLLDLVMPGLDGFEVLSRMQDDPELRHVPAILLSADDDTELVVRGIELGAADYVAKPFHPALLGARVDASLEKKRLRDRERHRAAALEREMEIGREIQEGFFPETLPQPDGWELAVRFRAARQVAGDFYDAFPLGDGSRLGLVVADVCDKGVGAALFMALFRTLLRATAERQALASGSMGRAEAMACIRHAVQGTNDYIARVHSRANMFATLFFAVLDPESGHVAYANGGHEPPIAIRGDGTLERLPPTGPAVGMLPGIEFRIAETSLAAGESLVVFTDGASEARATNGSLLGDEPLEALCAPGKDVGRLLADIEDAVAAHVGAAEQSDDITLLAIRRLR